MYPPPPFENNNHKFRDFVFQFLSFGRSMYNDVKRWWCANTRSKYIALYRSNAIWEIFYGSWILSFTAFYSSISINSSIFFYSNQNYVLFVHRCTSWLRSNSLGRFLCFFLSLGFDFESNRIELNGCDFFFSIPFLFSIYHWWWVLFIRHSGELVVDTSTHIIHSEKIYIFGIRGVYIIIIIIFIWYFGQNLFLGKKKENRNK